jgi:hypothetical protein
MKTQKLPPQLRLMLTAICLCAAPMAVQAQLKPEVQTGSHIPVPPKVVEAEHAGVIKKGFAQCLYRKNQRKVAALLENSDSQSIRYEKLGISQKDIGDYLGMSTCLGNQADWDVSALSYRFSPRELRSMLQEEDYLAAHERPPSLPPGSLENVDRKYVSDGPDLYAAQIVGAFSDCLTFENTAGVDAILRSMPGSKEERAAAQALGPSLGTCLSQGQSLSLTPANIRTFAVEGLWSRYAHGARSASIETNGKR